MDKIKKIKQEQQYKDYVKEKTPVHNVWLNMAKAFVTGGIICTFGQVIYNYCELQGLSKDDCSGWTALLLILVSVLLTGTNIYPRIAKWGGAGALVPITGFANSVAAPAIEYKKEGQVFGIGCKIFTIAGPVILYGILTSAMLGVVYWILSFKRLGWGRSKVALYYVPIRALPCPHSSYALSLFYITCVSLPAFHEKQ